MNPTNSAKASPEKHSELTEIVHLLGPFFAGTNTQRAIVFGSVAKGSQTKRSDLDLIIITDTEKRFFDRYETYERIHSLIPNRAVEMLIYTPDELNNISHRAFIRQILDEGKIIYEC
jgi:predicted nucleotidyltransferase